MHANEPVSLPLLPGGRSLARVSRATQGQALSVELAGVERPVLEHLDTVTALAPGDRVLVEATAEGVIVLGRLRQAGEPPAVPVSRDREGRLRLDNAEGVVLRASGNTLELRRDGAILLNGRTIRAIADGLHRLQGATLELN